MPPIIRLEKLWKRFRARSVLEDVSLEIREGETLTIIGGSGSGKSVTLKLILGLMHPDRGKVWYRGQDVTAMRERELIAMRREFGMLFQGGALFDSMNVAANVAYPVREHFPAMSDERVAAVIRQKLALVGLEQSAEMLPAELSGGMRKRVALARAIAIDPAVILYDEPTTGLDPANTQRINRLIRQCQQQLRITSVMVTHDMASAFQVTDRLALLYKRRIEFVGTPAEAKASANPVVRNFIQGNTEGE
ncbi:MAG: ABC transporter ATP-binding protein [Deltaproteobacteria bacterium]|nr:ABC transporter ATP-binding protein [Deltaproteobacteria bacterium]